MEPFATTPPSPPTLRVRLHRWNLAWRLCSDGFCVCDSTRSQNAGAPGDRSLPCEQRRVAVGAAPGPVLRLPRQIPQVQRAQHGGGGEDLPGHGWAVDGRGALVFFWGPLQSNAHVAVVFVLPPDRCSRANYKIHGGERLCVQVPVQRPSYHQPRMAGHESG